VQTPSRIDERDSLLLVNLCHSLVLYYDWLAPLATVTVELW